MSISFPLHDGARSTSALGRSVISAALAERDSDGARAAASTAHWRKEYVVHFRRLVEAGLHSSAAAESIAERGLAQLSDQMVWRDASAGQADAADGAREWPLSAWAPIVAPGGALDTHVVEGTGPPVVELVVPVEGRQLSGPALLAQLDAWVAAGVMEPSAAGGVRRVAEHPQWLSLADRTVVCLGAGAELSPLRPLVGVGCHRCCRGSAGP